MKRMDGGWNNHDEASGFERNETVFSRGITSCCGMLRLQTVGRGITKGQRPALFGSFMKKHHGRPRG